MTGNDVSMATLDVLLHPVRLRILQSLLNRETATTALLRRQLPDIAPATLYRHIAVLIGAGILEVVHENRVRGTVERTYRVRWDRAELDPADRAAMTTDDHRRAFTAFVASLLTDFDGYLAHEPADPTVDGVTYRQAALWLSDAEFTELLTELRAVITKRSTVCPRRDRTRRMISLIAMPVDDQPPPAEPSS